MAISKTVPITLDKERNLRFTTHSLVQMEKKTGVKLMGLDIKSLGFTEIVALLYAGLLHDDKNFSMEDAENIIDECGLGFVTEMVDALSSYLRIDNGNPQIQAGQ